MGMHLSRELLAAVARGEVAPRALVEVGLQHLTSLCPHCRDEYLAWRRGRTTGLRYESALAVLPPLLERHAVERQHLEEAARQDLKALLELHPAARLAKIARALQRFRSTALADLLLKESRKSTPADPHRAHELAEAAQAVLARAQAGPGVAELGALAAAYRGNACRQLDDNEEAHRHFAAARRIIQQEGVTDSLVCAEIDSCEAVLHLDQRRFRTAEELLRRSILQYSLAGAKEQAAHPLLTLGLLHYHQGAYDRAIEVMEAAGDCVNRERDFRLYASIRFNLALFLCDAGFHETAERTVAVHQETLRQLSDPYSQLRLVWLEGKIAAGLGELGPAEEALCRVREGFIGRQLGYDAAMASLDLALVYLRQGRTVELKELAASMHVIFEAQDVHREAMAALALFEQAVRRETVTKAWVEELASYLKKARLNPALRFRKRIA